MPPRRSTGVMDIALAGLGSEFEVDTGPHDALVEFDGNVGD
jgi:hypothetical protein